MGEVFRADDLKLGQPVALKFLLKKLADDRPRLESLYNEVRLARQVSHPNVCRVYDIAEEEGRHFLSMEYIDGEDLRGLLRRIGRLPADKGLQIARQLCAGLAAAHDKGVLHRDLKPANVMIDGRGHVRITDFGLARTAAELQSIRERSGTPAYMAPEQLLRGETSIQSDLYSLGLIQYEIFTGKPAHKAASITELVKMHEQRFSPPTPTSIAGDIDPAVEQAISTNRNLEFLLDLVRAQQAASAVNYLGKTIEIEGDTGLLRDGQTEWRYTLFDDAAATTITVTNEAGEMVFSGPGETTAGDHIFHWNGLSNEHEPQPDENDGYTHRRTSSRLSYTRGRRMIYGGAVVLGTPRRAPVA